MKTYFFKKDRQGKIPSLLFGTAFEQIVKFCLDRKNADTLSPAGRADFKRGKNYDVKQNASPILYAFSKNGNYIHGSSRVIYSTHVAYEIISETEEGYEIFIDLSNTDIWVVDKKEFVNFLLTEKGMVRDNPSRNQLNIQTIYNYSKNAYHGKKYQKLEAWLDENQLSDDNIVEDILEGFYSKCL